MTKNCWTCGYCMDPPCCDLLADAETPEGISLAVVQYTRDHCDLAPTTDHPGMPFDETECPAWIPKPAGDA